MIGDTVLVISPHMGDACVQCGGSISKWVLKGKKVYVLSLGPDSEEDWKREEQASGLVGFIPIYIGTRLNVGHYEYSTIFDIVKESIKKLRPNTIITTLNSDGAQQDHLITYKATKDAAHWGVREVSWETQELYKCNLLIPDDIESFSFVRPDYWEELGLYLLKTKVQSMMIYDYVPDSGRGPNFDVIHDVGWVNSLATLRGLWVGCSCAEVFQKEEI